MNNEKSKGYKSKRKNRDKRAIDSPTGKRVKHDIVKLFQKQEKKVSVCEITISDDDSSDFVIPSTAGTSKRTKLKSPIVNNGTRAGLDWLAAAKMVAEDIDVITKASNLVLNGNTETSGTECEITEVYNTSNCEDKPPHSPDLFDSNSSDFFRSDTTVETPSSVPGEQSKVEYVECQVDVDPSLFLSGFEKHELGPDTDSIKDLIREAEQAPSEKDNTAPERETRMIKFPPDKPNGLVIDGVKKQATITSFFGVRNLKPTLTFVEDKPEVGKLKKVEITREPDVNRDDSVGAAEWTNSSKRACPFYKKIPGTKFAVDAFSYGPIPGVEHYFLSHFHSDHYTGLTRHFSQPLYCSQVTANLVSLKLGIRKSSLNVLSMNVATVVDGIEVTPVEANHCPGAVMFVFHFPKSGYRILHTGDFRFHQKMTSGTVYSSLQARIHEVFLDTTYLNPSYNFPAQEEIVDFVKDITRREAKPKPRLLVVCGSYTIGKEKVFMAVAEVLDCLVWASPEKRRVWGCLDEPGLRDRTTMQATSARVHVLPMQRLSHTQLQSHLRSHSAFFDELLAFKPTGWTHSSGRGIADIRPSVQGATKVYGVPYSEHSSFGELERFLKFLRPKRVIPTVNVGSQNSRNQMNSYIQKWLKEY